MSDRIPTRVLDTVLAQQWAMEPEYLQGLLEVANRDHGPALEALAARNDKPLDNTQSTTVRDGVAIVPVVGPLFRYANLFTMLSGATSIGTLATDFTAALEDRAVRAIVLSVDSPGGEVNGIAELATMIMAARDRKPVYAHVGHSGASGAYWLASAAEKVFVAPTALVGSVGAVMTIRDTRKVDEARGIRTIEIVSSQSPDKRVDPTTDVGLSKLQAVVDRLGEEFVAAVARQRGVSVEKVLADFGKGGLLVGADAVKAGMADGVSTLEAVIASLSSTGSPAGGSVRNFTPRAAAAASSEMTMDIKTVSDLRAAYPDLVAQLEKDTATGARAEGEAAGKALGVTEGATAERNRIIGIQGHQVAGTEKLVAEMVADGKTTADQAAARILAEVKGQGPRALAGLKADEPQRTGSGPTAAGGGGDEMSAYDRGRVIAMRAKGKDVKPAA